MRFLPFLSVALLAFSLRAAPVLPPWPLPLPQGPAEQGRTARWTDEDFSFQIDFARALSARELAAYSASLAADGWRVRFAPSESAARAEDELAGTLRNLRAQGFRELADSVSALLSEGAAQWEKPPMSLLYLPGKNVLVCSFPFSDAVPPPSARPGEWLFSTPLPLAGATLSLLTVSVSGGILTAAEMWNAPRPGADFLDAARSQLVANGWQPLAPGGAAPPAVGAQTAAMDQAFVSRLFGGTAMFRSAAGEEAILSVRGGGDPAAPPAAPVGCLFLLHAPAP